MVIAGSEGRITLGTLSLSGLVPRAQTVVAEAMETLGQNSVLPFNLARRTRQRLLILSDLLLQDLVHV